MVYKGNRTWSSIPYELSHEVKPNLEQFNVFGGQGYVFFPSEKRKRCDISLWQLWDITNVPMVSELWTARLCLSIQDFFKQSYHIRIQSKKLRIFIQKKIFYIRSLMAIIKGLKNLISLVLMIWHVEKNMNVRDRCCL